MKRYPFDKLIRSKVPSRMLDQGVIVNARKLEKEEYIIKLKEKIIEEAGEVFEAESKEDLIIELADVMEVIFAIGEASGISLEEIELARTKKKEINGHFNAKCYVNYIEVAEDNHKVIAYLEDKNRPYVFN